MAGYKGHILFALIFAAAITYLFKIYNYFSFTYIELLSLGPILFIYAILPDIDISSSKISSISRIAGLFIILIFLLLDLHLLAITVTIILLILQFVKHRGFIHTISAGLIFAAPLAYFNIHIAILGLIGFISHLLLDGKVKLY